MRLWIMMLLCGLSEIAVAQYLVSTVPSPKEHGQGHYVSNPEGILGWHTVDSLNRLAHEVDSLTSAELAIVAIRDFVGDDDFDFALELFNTWGIGKREANNGLLLMIATDRRTYRFITGYGMEAVLPDALLKRIGEGLLVPRFRAGDYDGGVLAAMDAVKGVVLDPASAADLSAKLGREASWFYRYRVSLLSLMVFGVVYYLLWKMAGRAYIRIQTKRQRKKSTSLYLYYSLFILLFSAFLSIFAIAFFGIPPGALYSWSYLPLYISVFFGLAIWMLYVGGLAEIRANRTDVAHRREAIAAFHRHIALPLLMVPVSWIALFAAVRRNAAERQRLVPPAGDGWRRVDREANPNGKPYLDKGQLAEEKAGTRSYEIWTRAGVAAATIVPFMGGKRQKFETCPSCGYFTFTKPFVKTITSATKARAGQGERMQHCRNCSHKVSLGMVVLPKISESSGSGGSGGSGGGSSSGGGSWGGGSSGGGGAGGRW